MKLTLAEVAEICDGVLIGDPQTEIRSVATDSRRTEAGSLFVAIPGPRFDGHDFIEQALAQGAHGALVSRERPSGDRDARVVVSDTVRALGTLARALRRRFDGPVIAITGSNGKTTTKEMCAEILDAAGLRVRRSPGNFNNEIGLPLSLLRLEEDDEALVVELGMNHAGEIDALAQIAEPSIGTITQIAPAHLGPLGSIEAIAAAKGELFERIRDDGVAIVNQDDARIGEQARRFPGRQISFGTTRSAQWRAAKIETDEGHGRFTLETPEGEVEIRLSVPGRHMVENALCAAATAAATDLLGSRPLDAIRKGLEKFEGVVGRLRIRPGTENWTILDDSYNANPASVLAALETLQELASGGRSVSVLGDMLELGDTAELLHAEIGEHASRLGLSVLVAVGPLSSQTARAARESGTPEVHWVEDAAAASELVAKLLRPGDTVLVKGSLGMKMKQIADAISRGPA